MSESAPGTREAPPTPVLQVDALSVSYRTPRSRVQAVRSLSLSLPPGRVVAIVGESGSGKTTAAHAMVRMLARSASIDSGRVLLGDVDLVRARPAALRAIRGSQVGIVPQDPLTSLNPLLRIGDQVGEVLRVHRLATRRDAPQKVIEALTAAGIDRPELRARQLPHELSGGMRQRVLIAIAIIARPRLLIADEPTSALDVTVQRRILDHLDRLREGLGMATLLITHDLGVAADRADQVLVMHEGRVVERGTPREVLESPSAEYTKRLIDAAPSLNTRVRNGPGSSSRTATTHEAERRRPPVVEVRSLVRDFDVERAGGDGTPAHRAVDGVTFSVEEGTTFALVGESGSGKSTTARLLLRLDRPDAGRIVFRGRDITDLRGRELRLQRREMQLVQQNPYASLNPRMSVERIIGDPLAALPGTDRATRRRRVAELLDLVQLPAGAGTRSAHQLSGGQRQRVAIARALAISPRLLVLDEPVSALDVRVQQQILELLTQVQHELGTAYLFITHDLAVVREIAHTVGVMRRGAIVELGPTGQVFSAPRHEYTAELLLAIPGTLRVGP